MARGRMLLTTISHSEQMADLPNDRCRVIATWAIAHLDREGRITASPRRLRVIVVPLLAYTDDDVATAIAAMCAGRDPMAVRYTDATGQCVLWFPKFAEAQRGAKLDREAPSKFGAPPAESGACPESVRSESASRAGAHGSIDLTSLPLTSVPDPDARETTQEPAALSAALVDLCPRLSLDADKLVPIWLKAYRGIDFVRVASEALAGVSEHGEDIRAPGPFLGKVFKNAFADWKKSSAAAHEADHKKRKAAEAEDARLLRAITPPKNPVPLAQLTAGLMGALQKGEK